LNVYEQALVMALILLLGLLTGRLGQKIKMPMVVGFILAGIILSPSLTNVISEQMIEELEILRVLGLGMIAMVIGGELEIKKLRGLLHCILDITLIQVIGTFVAVFAAMHYLMGLPLPESLLLGAISTASAPASPVAVVREFRARGAFTSTLLGVVGFLDAVAIIFFAIISALAGVFLRGGELALSFFLEPLLEIGGSVLLGAGAGLVMIIAFRFIERKKQVLVLLLGMVLMNSSVAHVLHLSPLLVNMLAGFTVANLYPRPEILQHFEEIELPILIAFFLLAGASLRLDVLAANWLVVTVYIIVRGLGKVGGTFLGARLAGAQETVQKYLGFAMFSKAGVTIGLIMVVQDQFPEIASTIVAIELAAVAACSIIGPVGERFAVLSSGEAWAR